MRQHSTRCPRRRIAAAAAALGLAMAVTLSAPPSRALAADNGSWAVTPTPPENAGPSPRLYFFLEAPPGQTVTDSVRVANLTDQPMSFEVYGADAFNTERDGGFGLRGPADQQTGIGQWTSVPVRDVVLEPRTQVDIPFTVVVPTNATPGDHVGGIVARESTASGSTRSNGVDVKVQRAVGARIYLRVAGPTVPGLTVSDVHLSHPFPLLPVPVGGDLTYTVRNTGNVHLAPTISITATGLFGHRLRRTTSIPQTDLLPGARTEMRSALDGLWPLDIVTVTVTAEGPGGVQATASDRAVVVSWSTLALLALLTVAAVRWARRRRRSRTPKPRGAAR